MRPQAHKRSRVLGGTLALVAFVAGYFLSDHVSISLVAGVLKYAIGAVGVVWLFSLSVFNKLSDVTDMPGLDYRQHRGLEDVVRVRLQRFWLRAFSLALLGLLIALPSVVIEAKLLVPAWLVGLALTALTLALWSLRGIWAELEEIRQIRSQVKETERMEKERLELLKAAKDSSAAAWTPDERLDGFRNQADLKH